VTTPLLQVEDLLGVQPIHFCDPNRLAHISGLPIVCSKERSREAWVVLDHLEAPGVTCEKCREWLKDKGML